MRSQNDGHKICPAIYGRLPCSTALFLPAAALAARCAATLQVGTVQCVRTQPVAIRRYDPPMTDGLAGDIRVQSAEGPNSQRPMDLIDTARYVRTTVQS